MDMNNKELNNLENNFSQMEKVWSAGKSVELPPGLLDNVMKVAKSQGLLQQAAPKRVISFTNIVSQLSGIAAAFLLVLGMQYGGFKSTPDLSLELFYTSAEELSYFNQFSQAMSSIDEISGQNEIDGSILVDLSMVDASGDILDLAAEIELLAADFDRF
jgi:hypothetical protein